MTLPAGAVVHRFYTAEYDSIFFDPSLLGRLNAPDGSYGVLYVAEKPWSKALFEHPVAARMASPIMRVMTTKLFVMQFSIVPDQQLKR
jgi:hypothetical protein